MVNLRKTNSSTDINRFKEANVPFRPSFGLLFSSEMATAVLNAVPIRRQATL